MPQLDSISFWVIGLILIAGLSVVVELGYQLGKRISVEQGMSKHPVESAVCGALFGLMAFMMAFTFGAAMNRYVEVRKLALADANVAASLMLAADTLDETHRSDAQKLVREYLELRATAARDQDLEKLESTLARSIGIQQELWQIGNEVRQSSEAISLRLYQATLIKLIESDITRQTTVLHTRLPPILWGVLGFLAVLATSVLGLSSGLHGRRSRLVASLFIVAYSFVFVLIVDLDRPKRAFFQHGDPAATHVLKRMQP